MASIFVYEFVSGGSRIDAADPLLPQGLAMRNAIVADLLRIGGTAVVCATGRHHPGCALPDRGADAAPDATLAAVTPNDGENAQAFVTRVAKRHDAAWIVAPESDAMLAHLCDAVERKRWVGCSASAIRVASSKRATLKALARRGIPTPLALQASHRGRWIVKPDDGAGAMSTVVHADCDTALVDLNQRHAGRVSATLEPFVDGEALSIAMLVGPGSIQPLAFNRQRIVVDDASGVLWFDGVDVAAIDMAKDPRATRLHTLALDVVRSIPGLSGFVGIDLVWHEAQGPYVVEVNPRVTSAYVGLSERLGRNVAEQVLLLHSLESAGG